jgi:hypothetical protein
MDSKEIGLGEAGNSADCGVAKRSRSCRRPCRDQRFYVQAERRKPKYLDGAEGHVIRLLNAL